MNGPWLCTGNRIGVREPVAKGFDFGRDFYKLSGLNLEGQKPNAERSDALSDFVLQFAHVM
jgi:hypothetical protein